uniref:Uncharacterized protein n=1 Tax=Chromera velia CCMP2878 TaxID=1169474 RepID=A0A0G4I3A7_9ALVE|eukprot:Cvel_10614.t1-p1 / transcript=Cvel_10614.t1 / gene=Cvel_10614 / organism=Chromera_velia_CCMP2878 / gene_product=Putative ankyrin repeat protein L93, putative / transcript_product=Putative ankyrin repeat protein L93, putative / location=Cvel_scaffold644:35159-36598(+) / protein_length=480 / sequence_SO=supercontig / SO=protein_coding / is_pseudo=false
MEETAVNSPPTIDAFLERLKALEGSLLSEFRSTLRSQVDLVEKTLRAKEGNESPAAAAAATDVPRVRQEDVSVLEALEKKGRDVFSELSKKWRGDLGEVVSRHAKMDVGYLYEQGIGDVIRQFRPVSAETAQKALSDFISGANNGDDFRLCLKAGADINGLVEGQTALIRAVCANHTEAFETILSDHPDLEVRAGLVSADTKGVVTGDTAVIVASRQGRWGMVRSLIAEGANVDAVGGYGKKALQVACEAAERELDSGEEDPDDVFRLGYDPQIIDPAVRSAVSEVLKDLLMKTSDVADLKISARRNFCAESLVHFFSWHEFEHLLLLSLSRGVNIDAVDEGGWTALMCIAARSRPQYVQILLDNGADVNKSNGFYSPLAAAMSPYFGRDESFMQSVLSLEVCKILLDRGADVNSRILQAGTVIHEAVKSGVTEFVRLFVERGADLQLTDNLGRTPHDLAVQSNSSAEIVALVTPRTAEN